MRTQCREYELANHLAGETVSNVLAVVSDAKLPEARVLSHTDYYAFGSAMPGRSGGAYRYGFNTQERSPELAPDHHTAEFWEYDARIGRRWNVDPVVKQWESGYAVLANGPVARADAFGDDDFSTTGQYLGTDGSKTHDIRIMASNTLPANLYQPNSKTVNQTVGANNSSLMATYKFDNKDKRQALTNIVLHYNREMGYKGTTGVRKFGFSVMQAVDTEAGVPITISIEPSDGRIVEPNG